MESNILKTANECANTANFCSKAANSCAKAANWVSGGVGDLGVLEANRITP
jgi:hypothetical protein